MPNRFKSFLSETIVVETVPYGVQVIPPLLQETEEIQIHFMLSWSSKKNNNSSTYFAVDQRADFVLKLQLGDQIHT